LTVLRRIWSGETETRRQVLIAAAAVVAAGIALVVVDTAADFGWLRFPGAVLITIGGAAGGVAVGLLPAARERFWARLAGWRVRIAIVVAVIVATPAMVAMGSAAFGPLAGGGDAHDTALVVVGAVVGFILMLATMLSGVLAVQATRKRVAPAVDRHGREDGEAEDPS
jgi:hypothetical protein